MLRYVTHANVAVDPTTPVPQWRLSDVGRRRVEAMLGQPWVQGIDRVVTSAETKALETAEIVAGHLGLRPEVRPATGEIDRSSTGYVDHERHEALADRLFAHPSLSADGWERAIDARARIVAALADLLHPSIGPTTTDPTAGSTTGSATGPTTGSATGPTTGSMIVVGHGGVGTLLWCALAGRPIDRRHDQPGQGHYFTVDLATCRPVHGWRPIDVIEPIGDAVAQ